MNYPLHSIRVRIRAPRYGGATASMESLHQNQAQKTLRRLQTLERRTVLHRPRQRSLDELRTIKYGEFLEKPLGRIIPVQTYEKDAWTFLELLRLQDALIDSQLLMVEGKPSDQSCYFLLVGPPRPNTLFILKEGIHFHGIKDPIKCFGKYCDFHCRCS